MILKMCFENTFWTEIEILMKKSVFPYFLVLCILVSTSFADYSDGWITEGEYEGGVEWFTTDPPLIVDGGGQS